jgi:phosphoglycolate phosphatase-like HAD superfamily hydrolase
MKKLVLFDIDGTLISSGGAGTRSMDLAFKDIFGIDKAFNDITMAGKTDIEIIKEGLKTHEVPHWDGNVEKMKDKYLYFLAREINNPERTLKPGIKNALDMLKQRGMPTGLLTGNLEEGARIKLTPCGINDYFLDGAFGSDDEDRDKLLPIAINKFARKGLEFSPEDCIVVGDTPRDVRCAKIHGACCIAVATGPYSKENLLATDADLVLDSLEDTEKYMKIMLEC